MQFIETWKVLKVSLLSAHKSETEGQFQDELTHLYYIKKQIKGMQSINQ